MSAPSDPERAVDRATGYPYERPEGSFRFHPSTSEVQPLVDDPLVVPDRALHPVLAIGSNAAPQRLEQKFLAGPPIAVVPAMLRGYDVVYAACISAYGALPATLVESAGTSCQVHLTFLDDEQLAIMNASEDLGGTYDLVSIAPEHVTCGLVLHRPPHAYRAVRGALCVDGAPRALKAITATGRRAEEWLEVDALQWLAGAHGLTLEDLVLGVTGGALHAELNDWLAARSCG